MAKVSFNDLINSETPVLVDFYADWCGPCRAMAPVLKELKNDIGETGKIVKINVDHNQAISNAFQIRGIPTFMVFQKGEMKWRASGMQTKKQLKEVMQALV